MSKNIDWNAVKEKVDALYWASRDFHFRLRYVKDTEAPAAVEAERNKLLSEALVLADELRQLTMSEDERAYSVANGHIALFPSIDSAVLAKSKVWASTVADSDEEGLSALDELEVARRVKRQLREDRINAEVQRRLEEAGE